MGARFSRAPETGAVASLKESRGALSVPTATTRSTKRYSLCQDHRRMLPANSPTALSWSIALSSDGASRPR